MANNAGARMDALFGAMSDSTRRTIMARLAHAPGSTVGELMRGSELAPQSFTKHLDVLTAAGLIERVKDGRQRRVYPVARALDPALAWIEQQQRFWSPRLDALVRVAEAREQLQRKKDS